MFRYNKNTIYD